ncbi:hypothetical protein Asppvi_003324 [Aspergillus pseudoviridinutans]|uniref:Zn(2)-C6 fungal-type domain-containing protein n=1 Tax=Aspergillus pseudoviridinutans TaxID=1517512 RepID=A0A9P3B4B5_9EURO|nr:uncharacterized protein Asppvi_003324 [Aspergillus pseudoviridinutans]GIJ84477.1 hypothetical protein Asppvi_003324 [Aspergillus pseudoviridinutans]
MFGTLHWNPHSKETEFIEWPHGSSNPEKNPACDQCRARKVKCRKPDNEGCIRCTRQGKTCTFSRGRQRGKHRVKHAPREQLPSSLSSTSKGTGTDKDEDKPSPAAAPSIADNNDSERGQQSLLDGIFDISLLADFDHEPSDRHGEDTSLTLFSTIFPSTKMEPKAETEPEPEPRMSMSATLLSPPLSSEDKIQHYPPPAAHPDPSLFDICIAMPTALRTSASTASGPCQCLAAIVFAVEDLEASCTAGHRAELDSITAYQKEVITRCRSQLKCSGCMARRETLVLLVFMLEKLVAACGRIVGLYRVKDAQVQVRLPSPSSSLVNDNGDADADRADCSISTDWRKLLVGDYEISSPQEWEHLVRVLIFLQLRAVMELLADVNSTGGEVLGETLSASLAQAEIRLGELEKDILIL